MHTTILFKSLYFLVFSSINAYEEVYKTNPYLNLLNLILLWIRWKSTVSTAGLVIAVLKGLITIVG